MQDFFDALNGLETHKIFEGDVIVDDKCKRTIICESIVCISPTDTEIVEMYERDVDNTAIYDFVLINRQLNNTLRIELGSLKYPEDFFLP